MALFVDISKAFDTVDHDVLLTKLSYIGIRGNLLQWFTSYLQNRYQVVKIKESFSNPGNLCCGVPQGSVLGPILFLIYFNSIFEVNLIGSATAFADDLALNYASHDGSHTLELLQSDLRILSKWFYHHRLSISDKTRIMTFGRYIPLTSAIPTKYHAYQCTLNQCTSQCFEIEVVNEFKYLGLTIDSQLTWCTHLKNIRKNVLTAIHKFYYLRQFCPRSTLRQLYHALVESIIMYGISSWGGIYFDNLKDLFIAQKSIIKLIYNRPRRTPTLPLFKEFNLLPLRYLYVFKVLKIFFVRSSSFHYRTSQWYNLRTPNMFVGLRCKKEKFRRFYLYMALYWFHKLPLELKMLTPNRVHLFVSKIRKWLLSIDDIEMYF